MPTWGVHFINPLLIQTPVAGGSSAHGDMVVLVHRAREGEGEWTCSGDGVRRQVKADLGCKVIEAKGNGDLAPQDQVENKTSLKSPKKIQIVPKNWSAKFSTHS